MRLVDLLIFSWFRNLYLWNNLYSGTAITHKIGRISLCCIVRGRTLCVRFLCLSFQDYLLNYFIYLELGLMLTFFFFFDLEWHHCTTHAPFAQPPALHALTKKNHKVKLNYTPKQSNGWNEKKETLHRDSFLIGGENVMNHYRRTRHGQILCIERPHAYTGLPARRGFRGGKGE